MARRDHENDIRRLGMEFRVAAQALGLRLLDFDGVIAADLQSDIEALRALRARLDAAKAEFERVYG